MLLQTRHQQRSVECIKYIKDKEYCFIRYHGEVGSKNEEQPNFFNNPQSVSISDETFFQVFDVASESINNS